jgi:uncharacterized protein (DUF305 family)
LNTQSIPRSDRRQTERRKAADAGVQHKAGQHAMPMASYGRFWAMVAASTVIGFGGMYLNTYQIDHVYFSWTRVFMAMIMGGIMTAVMMLFMWRMYPNKRTNAAVLGVAAALFVAGLSLVRTQATIGDVAYMRAMIPHHSIAIMTSSRARIEDPRVRKLADGIIESQKKEIAEMKDLIADLDR